MAKKFKEDEMKWILSVEATGAQAEIKSFSSTIQRLKNENREYADSTRELTKGMKEQEKEMRQLAKSGDTTSAKYQQLKNKVEEAKYNIEQNTKAINTNNKSIDEQRHRIDTVVRSLKTEEMTMSQLKRRAADLKKQLDNTAKATSPEAYDKLEKELKDVDDRMKQLKGTSSSLNDTMKGGMQVFAGNMMTKAVEGLQKLASKVKDFIDDGIEMATTADGVKHAFDNLDSPGLLSNLQKATKNTVNDFELMKAAVQAKDFRIPLQDLGKYLQFAQLKAQQTGQSVEYMTNSIITGLGRKSVMILDNLGLSAAEINENVKKTGDFMSAVANIVDTQLATAADGYISRADRVQQKTVLLENAKLKLGQRVMWLQEKYDNMVSYLAKDTINTLSTANEKYEEQLDKVVKLETEMPDLLRQYEDLSSKSNLSTQEQDKLKIVIEQISSMVPGVITQWDNYGRAIAISTDKVYEFVESQKAMLAYMNQDAIKETENNIKEYKEELDKAQQEYNQGGKIRFEGGNTMFQPQKPVLHSSPEIMAEIEGDIAKYGQLLEGAELHLNDLQGKTLDKYVAETKERKKFTAMTKEELNKWIKDEKNAASEYMNIAKQVFNSRFAQVTPNSPTTTTTNKNSTSPKSKTKEKSAADIAKEEAKALLDAEKADITAIQKSREQDLRNLQNYYNKSVMALNQSLADRKITKQQHEMMMIELDKNLAENVLRVETEYYDHSRNLQLQNAELKIDLVEKTEQRVLDAEKTANAARLAEQKKLDDLIKDFKGEFKITTVEENYQAQLAVLKASYQARKEMAEKNNLEIAELDKAYYRAKEQLEQDHENRLRAIRSQYGLVTPQEEYELELEQLQIHLNQKLLTEEQYEKAVLKVKRDYYKKQFDYYKNIFADAVSALQDAEIANIEAKYDIEIEAAQGNSEEVARLEEEKAQKKLDVEKKYADVNFAIKASQIIADTAVGIMSAFQLGPIAGAIAAAFVGLTGVAQLAMANAERNKVKNMTLSSGSSSSSSNKTGARVASGREDGGKIDIIREQDGKFFPDADYDPDRRGYVDRPTVIVGEGPAGHSKEWIASNAAVTNPTVAPVLDLIDKAQQAGNIHSFDLNAAMRAQAAAGYASGGSINTPTGADQRPVSVTTPVNNDLVNAIVDALSQAKFTAPVVLSDIEAQKKRLDTSRKIGTKR